VFPFQIQAGAGNPLFKASLVKANDIITSSPSIVTVPIADFSGGVFTGNQPTVTIVGFLQVFINLVDPTTGDAKVTVLNVSGCGNNAPTINPLHGTSPVPVRLITPPS
jgi:hypothetical protein